MTEPRFLVVRLGSLGDIVHTFPAVSGLRESFPNSEIIWLTHARWKTLVESCSLASHIWTMDSRVWSSIREVIAQIRKANFTTSIDYQGLWKSAAPEFLAGVKCRVGFSSESIREFGVPILYTNRVRATSAHVADQNAELSSRAGARHPVGPVQLQVPPEDQVCVRNFLKTNGAERYVVLSPGGGWRSKCWPAERFGALCEKIHQSLALPCVINYGPGEESLASAIQSSSGSAAPLLYNGSLGSLMALLQNALCIVGGDTGPLHLAVALGTPAVAIFGPTDPARNGPYGGVDRNRQASKESIVLRSPDAITTYKRGDRPDASLLKIEIDAVYDAVRNLLGPTA